MEKLLYIKIASRGDLLLAAPAFHKLRSTRPNAHITLLVGASCLDVAQHLPYFDEIQIINDHALMAGRWWSQLREAQHLFDLLKTRVDSETGARPCIYSEIIIFHRDWRYGFLAWLSGIPVRRGFHGKGGTSFLTHSYAAGEEEHHVSQYLNMATGKPSDQTKSDNLAPLAGLWKFHENEHDQAVVKVIALGFQPDQTSWIALGFGGGRNVKTQTELKTWPTDHYRELATRLMENGHRVVWVGDVKDAEKLKLHDTGLNLAGKLTVTETATVLGACRLVVTNDTLTLHLAEALGTPTIGIFGPTDPAHYRPLGKRSTHLWLGETLPCSPCHRDGYFPPCAFDHRCMKELSVESVLKKIESAFNN